MHLPKFPELSSVTFLIGTFIEQRNCIETDMYNQKEFLMRKEGLENFTLTREAEGKHQLAYHKNLSNQMLKQRQRRIVKIQKKLLGAKKKGHNHLIF